MTRNNATPFLSRCLHHSVILSCILLPGIVLAFFSHRYYSQDLKALFSLSWIPSFNIDFSLHLDGLSMLFVGVIAAIGVFIQLYAFAYMQKKPHRVRFHILLSLFMLAMLGLVLSDHLIVLFVFWELTTVTSYALISFNREDATVRHYALQAMLVTAIGGLALLAGLILLGEMAGSYHLSTILSGKSHFQQHPFFLPSLLLIFLGAFTKSAQFPFHFWLPHAMVAPTPVSAYLHSATMVKAGIYLLARFSEIYAGSPFWFYILASFGGFTALWCAIQALRQTDLKLMLAYSTNTALGKLTLLLALGNDAAISAAVLFVIAHALYKAALFMVVGNIDKATGTRNYTQLAQLAGIIKLSFFAAIIAALSKMGIPPLFGFLSKEYMYKAALDHASWTALLLLTINSLMAVMALVIVIKPFLQKTPSPPTKPTTSPQPILLWLPPFILAILSFAIPVMGLEQLDKLLILPASQAIKADFMLKPIALWQGFNMPLALSIATLCFGIIFYIWFSQLKQMLDHFLTRLPKADSIYKKLVSITGQFAAWQTRLLQHGHESLYVLLSLTILAGLILTSTLPEATAIDIRFYELSLALLLVSAAFVVSIASSHLLAVVALGMVGFITTLIFMIYSAPDVAKTQLLIETLLVIFLVIVMRRLSPFDKVEQHTASRRIIHALIASTIGISISLLLTHIIMLPHETMVSDFFAEKSVPEAYGRNIVNVILVDFRAFDTLGEIVVVVIAAIAATSLLVKRKKKGPQ